jgi:hypothetical protein
MRIRSPWEGDFLGCGDLLGFVEVGCDGFLCVVPFFKGYWEKFWVDVGVCFYLLVWVGWSGQYMVNVDFGLNL